MAMCEIEILDIIIDEEILLGDIELDGIKIGGEAAENLDEVLNAQDTLITSQEEEIDSIIELLEQKIIGVNAKLQTKTVIPSMGLQIIRPDSDFDGLDVVTVLGVTSDVDEDIQPENIRKGKNIVGVAGTLIELNGEEKTVTPTTTEQTIVPSEDKNAITKVVVNAVTSDIDENIKAENIREGISILGIAGSLEIGAEDNKLALILGDQNAVHLYEITEADIGTAEKIPRYFFENRTALTRFSSSFVTDVGEWTFYNCKQLFEVNAPRLTKIGQSAFRECKKLEKISLDTATEIGTHCFYNCSTLKKFNAPDLQAVETYCCYSCTELETANVPYATSIGSYAFSRCTVLTSVTMEKVEEIKNDAFSYCYKIGYVEIPASCTLISGGVFTMVGRSTPSQKCTYKLLPTTPPTIYYNTFTKSYIDKIIVPKGCGDIYKSATNWSDLAEYMEEAV
jgi:hypothetical protein